METNYEAIIQAAMALPPRTRAMLADHLLESLTDSTEQKRIEARWSDEAERRIRELEEVTIEPIPGEDVDKEIRELLK